MLQEQEKARSSYGCETQPRYGYEYLLDMLAARCLLLVGVIDLSMSMGNMGLHHGLPCSGLDRSPECCKASLHLLQEWGKGHQSSPTPDPALCTSSEVMLGGKQPPLFPVRLSPKQEPALSAGVLGDETGSHGSDPLQVLPVLEGVGMVLVSTVSIALSPSSWG